MTEAFLYRWTEISTGKWYEGSRTKLGCHPNDGYLCSSRIVKKRILNDPTNWRRTILVIGSPRYIRSLESSRLQSINAAKDPMSYNMDNGNGVEGFSATGKRWMHLNNVDMLVDHNLWECFLNDGWVFGRNERIRLMLTEVNSKKVGKRNGAYGRNWMTNGFLNKLATPDEQEILIKDGWVHGVKKSTREKLSNKSSAYYATRSIDEETVHRQALSSATANYHARMTDAEKQERSKICSNATLRSYYSKSKKEQADIIYRLNKKSKLCEVCGITTNAGNYTRWHGENCRKHTK